MLDIVDRQARREAQEEEDAQREAAPLRPGQVPRRAPTRRCTSPARSSPTRRASGCFIADSTHHRIVITDLDGKKIAVAGTGQPGLKDGAFDKAQFDDPQGMAVQGDTLYVADRKNNCLRQLDLKAQTVKTVAGTTRTFQLPGTPRAMA